MICPRHGGQQIRLLVTALLTLTLALVPGEAFAAYQSGWDPDDISGAGDIATVTVRRYPRDDGRWLKVGMTMHGEQGGGIWKWKLDGRGGPAPDHWIVLFIDPDDGHTNCRLSTGEGHVTGTEVFDRRGVRCRVPMDEMRMTRRPRFRATTTVMSIDFDVVGHDRAPNDRREWFR